MADYFDKIRPVLEALQIGEAVIYPISRMKSVRTQASELGAIHNRQYTTKTDREARTITVKRTKWSIAVRSYVYATNLGSSCN